MIYQKSKLHTLLLIILKDPVNIAGYTAYFERDLEMVNYDEFLGFCERK